MADYSVLSPWAAAAPPGTSALSPRLTTLEGKTIGMFGDFMNLSVYMLRTVEKELAMRYPTAVFSYFQYDADPMDIEKDDAYYPLFKEWAAGTDCVLAFYGSVPSSSLFLGYNCAHIEKMGIPTVLVLAPRTYSAGQRGCKGMGVCALRIVQYDIDTSDKIYGNVSEASVAADMASTLSVFTDELVMALTAPLTEAESTVPVPDRTYSDLIISGSQREISTVFYKNGWSTGVPIDMPTRAAVDEMLRGTDLPRDYVVGLLPPKMGAATVEKIAVNAVMAGCLPTYMPVLIAAVRGVLAPQVSLEGWSCSQSTWGPVVTVSGSIADDIGLNVDDHMLTPAFKANACIARAFGYIMMNIAGIRPGVEDLSEMGHEFRLGYCIGDNMRESPWGPMHEDFGLRREDSAVTMFWPQEHRVFAGTTTEYFLTELCKVIPYGWDPGMAVIFSPKCARMLADEGWNRQSILDYIVEYGRRPASEVDLQWLKGNNHPPGTVSLPVNSNHYTRIFWSKRHMFALVAGGKAGCMATVLGGGGDHGGPSCTRIELPKNWDALVAEYRDIKPSYIEY